jgi:hypothetical protein
MSFRGLKNPVGITVGGKGPHCAVRSRVQENSESEPGEQGTRKGSEETSSAGSIPASRTQEHPYLNSLE